MVLLKDYIYISFVPTFVHNHEEFESIQQHCCVQKENHKWLQKTTSGKCLAKKICFDL
jgi:hypothetical protein